MPQPGSPVGMTERTFELVERGRSDGVDTAFDMHTRPFGELNLSAALPVWAVAGGPAEEFERRLGDPAERGADQGLSEHDPAVLPRPRP